jgi:diguanylate cyclase (GGDEF)-like protein/PAS domain S-box-containing protein
MDTSVTVVKQGGEFFQTVLTHVADAVVTTDAQGRVTFANPAAEKLYGMNQEAAVGRRLADLLSSFHAASGETLEEITIEVAGRGTWKGEITHRIPDGPDVLVEASISLLHDHAGAVLGSVSVLREISDRKAAEALIAYQATHDSLTGLLTRRAFMSDLQAALDRNRQVALVFLDLNAFKSINDLHGHERGDEVLRSVAGRLAGAIRPGDVAGRFGGDEFVILAHDLDGAAETEQFLERVTSLFAAPIRCRGGDRHLVGASIGVARSTPGDNPDGLLRRADTAMYEAKHSTEAASAYRLAR